MKLVFEPGENFDRPAAEKDDIQSTKHELQRKNHQIDWTNYFPVSARRCFAVLPSHKSSIAAQFRGHLLHPPPKATTVAIPIPSLPSPPPCPSRESNMESIRRALPIRNALLVLFPSIVRNLQQRHSDGCPFGVRGSDSGSPPRPPFLNPLMGFHTTPRGSIAVTVAVAVMASVRTLAIV